MIASFISMGIMGKLHSKLENCVILEHDLIKNNTSASRLATPETESDMLTPTESGSNRALSGSLPSDAFIIDDAVEPHGQKSTSDGLLQKNPNVDNEVSHHRLTSDQRVEHRQGRRMNPAEWSFTLYDFEGNGHINKEDLSRLIESLSEVMNSCTMQTTEEGRPLKLRLSLSSAADADHKKRVSAESATKALLCLHRKEAHRRSAQIGVGDEQVQINSAETRERERKMLTSQEYSTKIPHSRQILSDEYKLLEMLRKSLYLADHSHQHRKSRRRHRERPLSLRYSGEQNRHTVFDDDDLEFIQSVSQQEDCAEMDEGSKYSPSESSLKSDKTVRLKAASQTSNTNAHGSVLPAVAVCNSGMAAVKPCQPAASPSSPRHQHRSSVKVSHDNRGEEMKEHVTSSAVKPPPDLKSCSKEDKQNHKSNRRTRRAAENMSSSHYLRRHRHREKNHGRAMRKVAEWIEQENLAQGLEDRQPVVVEHHHVHEHHHYYHYKNR